jgi:hypothetical protein
MVFLKNIIFAGIVFSSGCSWQKIPNIDPSYVVNEAIPLKVGIYLEDVRVIEGYGPRIVKKWEKMGLFKEIVYPYKKGEIVDIVLTVNIFGGWDVDLSGATLAGLTLGLSSPFVGTSMQTIQTLELTFENLLDSKYKRLLAPTSMTKLSFGILANSEEVSKKSNEHQIQKLANESSKVILNNKMKIMDVSKSKNIFLEKNNSRK